MFAKYKKNLKCSKEDKKECVDAIKKIIDLSNMLIKSEVGLPILLEETKNEEFIIKEGMVLINYGTDPSIFKKILKNYILYSSNQKDNEKLRKILISEGMLMLQAGYHPYTIGKILISNLGEDISMEFFEYLETFCIEKK